MSPVIIALPLNGMVGMFMIWILKITIRRNLC